MKQKLFSLIFGLIVCGGFLNAQTQTLDEAVLRAAQRIGADLPAGSSVALIHFRSDKETLSTYVINELHGAILRNRRVTSVKPNEGQLQSIRDGLRFTEAGEIDEESARSIGLLLGVKYLISGSMERGASGYDLLISAVDAESADRQSQYSASVNPGDMTLATLLGITPASQLAQSGSSFDPNAWKNKWVYLGGMLGAGYYKYSYIGHYNYTYDSYRDKYYDPAEPYPYTYYDTDAYSITDTHGSFALGFVSEFALLPFFSIEVGIGYDIWPILAIPILAKLGYRFTNIELFFDIGGTISVFPGTGGFTLGGTFGFHVGPGILYAKMIGIPNSGMMWYVGYKVGLGKTKEVKAKQTPQAVTSGNEGTQKPQADMDSDEGAQEPQANTGGDEETQSRRNRYK